MATQRQNGDAWVVFLDVYGFGAKVLAGNEQELSRLFDDIEGCKSRAREEVEHSPTVLTFSDSFFLVFFCDDAPRARWSRLSECIADTQRTLNVFFREGLPLRGGIAHGGVVHGSAELLGAPVVRAVSYESLAPGPLVLLPAREVMEDNRVAPEAPRLDRIRVKRGGLMLTSVVLPSATSEYSQLVKDRLRESLVAGPYDVAEAWAEVEGVLNRRVKD